MFLLINPSYCRQGYKGNLCYRNLGGKLNFIRLKHFPVVGKPDTVKQFFCIHNSCLSSLLVFFMHNFPYVLLIYFLKSSFIFRYVKGLSVDNKYSSQTSRKNLFEDIVFMDPRICETDYVTGNV